MTVKPDVWMPLYVGDYRKDTNHLSAELHGVYLLLLMDCWTRGGLLPPDMEQLANIARIPLARWRKIHPIISPFFQVSADGWRHKRVTQELAIAVENTKKRAEAGRLGASARWQTRADANGKRMPDA